MPKLDRERIPFIESTGYPPHLAVQVKGRSYQRLTADAGLTQFGVNICRLQPGAASSVRHWHEREDEFAYVLDGELMLVDDTGSTPLVAGDCVGFPAGQPNGHHIVNRSAKPASFLIVGTRSPVERVHYPDADLAFEKTAEHARYTHKDGTPY